MLTLGNTAPLYYLPVLLGVSLFTGALTGFLAVCLFRALRHTELMKGMVGWERIEKDEVIARQLEMIHTMTEHQFRRMGDGLLGAPPGSAGAGSPAGRACWREEPEQE